MQRAVLRNTLGHPLSVYPVVFGALGAMAAVLFGAPGLLVWGASGVFGLGFVSWIFNFFVRRDRFASRYLERAHAALAAKTEQSLQRLSQELEELEIQQGVDQLERFRTKLDTLEGILKRKLNRYELTYGRYLGMAEQVFLAAVDNLNEAVELKQSVSAIDPGYIERRQIELSRLERLRPEDESETRSLKERLILREEQLVHVSELLSQNEEALTKLDTTTAAIAMMKTGAGHAPVNLETAMGELALLAKRTDQYSNR